MPEENKTGSEKSPFWQSVERASQTVSQWPSWKQAGVLSRPVLESAKAPPTAAGGSATAAESKGGES